MSWISSFKRHMYRGDRPDRLARALNWLSAAQFSAGILSPRRAVTLEVPGRRSGRTVSVPIVVTDHEGAEYLVSMLGLNANWIRNVRAAGGRAVLRRRQSTAVRLEEVPTADRAPILKRYLDLAPGARPHFPIDRHARREDFEAIAGLYPVFRVHRT